MVDKGLSTKYVALFQHRNDKIVWSIEGGRVSLIGAISWWIIGGVVVSKTKFSVYPLNMIAVFLLKRRVNLKLLDKLAGGIGLIFQVLR